MRHRPHAARAILLFCTLQLAGIAWPQPVAVAQPLNAVPARPFGNIPGGAPIRPPATPVLPPIRPPFIQPVHPPVLPPAHPPAAQPGNPPISPPRNPPIAQPWNPPMAPPGNPPMAPPGNSPTAPPGNTPSAPPGHSPMALPGDPGAAPPGNTPTEGSDTSQSHPLANPPSKSDIAAEPKILVLDAGGKTRPAPKSIEVQLNTEVLGRSESVVEVLSRHGLAHTETTMAMFKKLNPALDISGGRLHAGSKINLIAPKTGTTGPAGSGANQVKLTFDRPAVARLVVKEQVRDAAWAKARANLLPPSAYRRNADRDAHLQAVARIESATHIVYHRAEDLSGADLGAVNFQIGFANQEAKDVYAKASAGTLETRDVEDFVRTSERVEQIADSLKTGKGIRRRIVSVSVAKVSDGKPVHQLQVYVLPAGVFDKPQLLPDDAQIVAQLTRLSFAHLTSPAHEGIENFDARVWVGPAMKYELMAKLVRQRAINKYRVISDRTGSLRPMSIGFKSPDDVVRP